MVIVYRLQGLDGEATEEIIEALNDDAGEQRDPEDEYKITTIMSVCGGLEAMMKFLQRISDFDSEKELAHLVLKLLLYCCKVRVNRVKLVSMKAVNVLLEKLKRVFPQESQADTAEMLLLIIENIVEQANKDDDVTNKSDDVANKDGDVAMTESDATHEHPIANTAEGILQMTMFLEKLASPLVKNNAKITKTMARIIPFLTYGDEKYVFPLPLPNARNFNILKFVLGNRSILLVI